MISVQKNSTREAVGGLLLLSVAYFAGFKRCLEHLPGAAPKELLGAAGAAALANAILRDKDSKKSACISAAVSMLGAAVVFNALGKGLKWEPLTYVKVGAAQAAILAGVFGQTKLYYPDGSMYQGEVRDGKPYGQGKGYDKNGKLQYEGEFANSKRHGQGKLYHENGKLWYEGEFVNGKIHGQGKGYDENGKLRYEGELEDNKSHGQGTLYDESGNVVHQGKFQDGNPV